MQFVLYFFVWTLFLYWIHRLAHTNLILLNFHKHHHRYIKLNTTRWKWNNLFLFNDDLHSTIDLWLTEVIPTLIFSYVLNQWWIFIFYYFWAAFIQESIEHNKNINLPFLTSGKWHLVHHKHASKNFGLFFPIWDLVFDTYKHVDK